MTLFSYPECVTVSRECCRVLITKQGLDTSSHCLPNEIANLVLYLVRRAKSCVSFPLSISNPPNSDTKRQTRMLLRFSEQPAVRPQQPQQTSMTAIPLTRRRQRHTMLLGTLAVSFGSLIQYTVSEEYLGAKLPPLALQKVCRVILQKCCVAACHSKKVQSRLATQVGRN